jgi:hypothetical protein
LSIVLAVFGFSCSGSSTTPSSNTTTFQGTLAGSGGQAGTLSITVQALVTVPAAGPPAAATGSLHLIGGSTTSLAGTFDPSTNGVNLSGGGFTLIGTATGGVLSGSYTSQASGAGPFSTLNATAASATTFCGTFADQSKPGGEFGIFNVTIAASGAASGAGVSKNVPNDPGFLITGQLTGSTLAFATFDLMSHKMTGTATATVQGTSLNGTCGSAQCTLTASTNACQ